MRWKMVFSVIGLCMLSACGVLQAQDQQAAPTPVAPPGGPIIGGVTDAQPTVINSPTIAPIESEVAETGVPGLTPFGSTSPTETTSIATPVPIFVPVAGAIGPYTYPVDVNPLTGLTVSDPNVLNRRPIVVKVSNSPPLVRPQSGINDADLVFEHYTEVGVTRFSAIFYANAPTRVGSIRSARLIDYELTPMYQGLLAFAGGSIGVEKRIYGSEAVKTGLCITRDDKEQCGAESDIIGPPGYIPPSDFADRAYKGVAYGPPYYFRDESIPVPHNLFVNLGALWELAAKEGFAQKPDLTGLTFLPEIPANDNGSGIFLQVRYATELVDWYFNFEDGLYYRSSDEVKHFDSNTNQQVRASNVVVLYAGHYLTDIVESGWGDNVNWSTQITLWPEGDMILFRDGKRYEGRWLRPSRGEALTFMTKTGELLYLKPGNTWIQVMPLPEQMNPDIEWVKFF
jgi:hypothetical protein